ncbi:DUF695 domain-containing protein [Acinetobacter sp. 3657]|uniref:DUF695 domain-containing protein n=1 Tax=Acinetobacter sp. 3657 TaxID=2817764 RepID=UPI002864559B|nr:uncharacterized protein (TIGR01619 family) [Prolinoborus sp. 3657]
MGFLNKFWSKKKVLTDTQNLIQPIEVPENWDFYMCQIDDQPASYFLNLALSDVAPIATRPNLLWLELKMNYANEDGLSSSEESDALFAVEDALIPALNAQSNALYIGRLTHNDTRDLYFYCANEVEKIKNIIFQVMQSFSTYQYRIGSRSDANWSTYFDCMYPNEEIIQCISNRSVLDNLRKHGDSLTIARPIDHWIYFQNETDQVHFITAIKALAFNVIQQNRMDENQDYPYQLQISKIGDIHQEAIDECVLQLWQLAKQSNAEYDGWETQIIKN